MGKVHELPPVIHRIGLRRSSWGVWIPHIVMGLVAVLRIDKLL